MTFVLISCLFTKIPNVRLGISSFLKMYKRKATSSKMKEKATCKRKSQENNDLAVKRILTYKKVPDDYFNQACEDLAKSLLGKMLVRKVNESTIVKGRIVETECYLGGEDKASQSFNGKRTNRNEPMFMKPGTAYVYMTYGMYFCFNISSIEPGGAVLLRALEPVLGMEYMFEQRGKKKKVLKEKELCNGPSKLCMSLNITKEGCNKIDMTNSEVMWIESDENVANIEFVTTSRIGIESAGEEWANKPLRFYILGNEFVSKRDKVAEKIILDRLECN